jgi:hypothetical protein
VADAPAASNQRRFRISADLFVQSSYTFSTDGTFCSVLAETAKIEMPTFMRLISHHSSLELLAHALLRKQ